MLPASPREPFRFSDDALLLCLCHQPHQQSAEQMSLQIYDPIARVTETEITWLEHGQGPYAYQNAGNQDHYLSLYA